MAYRYVRPTIVHADVVVSGNEPIGDGVSRVLAHYERQIANAKAHESAGQAQR
jgi:hypothetical protein